LYLLILRKSCKKSGGRFLQFHNFKTFIVIENGFLRREKRCSSFVNVCCVKLINHFFSERKGKMSNEKDVSKELTDAVNKVLSRREAVKKAGSIAAGAAIAFLGLSLPGVSQQKEAKACGTCCQGSCQGCTGGCQDGCSGGCYGECSDICQTSCTGSCKGGCEGTCMGCTETCSDDCTETCTGCTSSCADNCAENCTGTASE